MCFRSCVADSAVGFQGCRTIQASVWQLKISDHVLPLHSRREVELFLKMWMFSHELIWSRCPRISAGRVTKRGCICKICYTTPHLSRNRISWFWGLSKIILQFRATAFPLDALLSVIIEKKTSNLSCEFPAKTFEL